MADRPLSPTLNMFSGVKMLMYLFIAIGAFIATYPLYDVINSLDWAGDSAHYTAILCWWITAFTIIYMGTWWVYTGRFDPKNE